MDIAGSNQIHGAGQENHHKECVARNPEPPEASTSPHRPGNAEQAEVDHAHSAAASGTLVQPSSRILFDMIVPLHAVQRSLLDGHPPGHW